MSGDPANRTSTSRIPDLVSRMEANKEAAYTFVNNFNEYAKGRTGDEETDNRTMDEV